MRPFYFVQLTHTEGVPGKPRLLRVYAPDEVEATIKLAKKWSGKSRMSYPEAERFLDEMATYPATAEDYR